MCTGVFVQSVYKGIEGNTCEYTIESDSQAFNPILLIYRESYLEAEIQRHRTADQSLVVKDL